jgi:hypothetical protein
VEVLSLFEGLRATILANLELVPERDRRVVMGRNSELYQALVALDILLLQARLLSHARSRPVIEACWPIVRKVGVDLGYFQNLKGNREARRELRSFLVDFPDEQAHAGSPRQQITQNSLETRRRQTATYQEEVANVLLPQKLESMRDPHYEETLKALYPKTPKNCSPAEWERARKKLR